jgi:hypothetical protein
LSVELTTELTTMPELLDVVELKVATGRWEPGTLGTVVEVFDDGVLVEVSDEEGRTVDFVSLPRDAVTPVEIPDQSRLAV